MAEVTADSNKGNGQEETEGGECASSGNLPMDGRIPTKSENSPQDEERTNSQILANILSIQSLLSQFSHPRVRGNFLNGKFGWKVNPTLLPRIDKLRCLLFPRWSIGTLAEATQRNMAASIHLQSMVFEHDTILQLPGEEAGESLTAKDWYEVLETVAADSYWHTVKPEDRCVHITKAPTVEKRVSNVRPNQQGDQD